MALVLIIGATVGVTLAYLSDKTTSVVNTFTVGNVDIDLWEHKYDETTRKLGNDIVISNDKYKITPGVTDPKDPTVTVVKGSEACYVFIEVTAANNGNDGQAYFTWAVDTSQGWKKLNDEVSSASANVWYQEVTSMVNATTNKDIYVLSGSKEGSHGAISYSANLTQAQLANIGTGDNAPKLTITAYAVQSEGVTLEDAWTAAQASSNAIYNKDSGASQSN